MRNLLSRVIFSTMNRWHASIGSSLVPCALCLLPFLAAAAGCRQNMHDAPSYDPLEASAVMPKGSWVKAIIAGTVPRGFLNEDEHLNTGKVNGEPVTTFPFAITKADLDRGEERFNSFCAPCHGRTGEGNGMVVQRGFRQPPSYHIDRLRGAPVAYFFDVISNGFGVMPDYRAQVPVDDRWRIVAYVRALQVSQYVTATSLSDPEKAELGVK